MCYSRQCPYENYWGECEKPRKKPCPKYEEEEREETIDDRESEEE